MHTISYVSQSLIPEVSARQELGRIVDSANRKNQEVSVTGVLFLENQHFFQTIEGPKEPLHLLYDQIQQDNRHHKIVKLIDEPIIDRAFADWSLDTFYIDNPELITTELLQTLRSLYRQNFGGNNGNLIDFVKTMIDEIDTFKIKTDPGL